VKPLAILALLLGSAHADSWAPYGQRLHVAENEKYFLVLRHQDGEKRETAFELYERAADTKPPRVQETRLDETKVIVDAGDRVICKGVLNQQPLDAWVLSGSPCAVLFEKYANIGGGTTLSLLGADGKVAWRRKLADFKFRMDAFPRSTSSVRWNAGWWVDEARARVVIVARGKQYREVELATGKILKVDESVALDLFKNTSVRARRSMLRMCAHSNAGPKGWVQAARALREDAKQPMALRLEAVWALQLGADEEADPAIFRQAVQHLRNDHVCLCMLHFAPNLLGEESVPLLIELLRKRPDWEPDEVAATLARQGPEGLEALDEIASDEDAKLELRLTALRALAGSRTEFGAAAFAFVVRTADETFAKTALAGFADSMNWPLFRALAKTLTRAGAGDLPIARILGENPSRDYVAALEAAQERSVADSKSRRAIDAALTKCRAQKR
jgi:hypothetical protein